jgi:dihydroorotase-like cyclic amidohydrolase
VLAIVNARVWTNDPRRPWADALLVQHGRVLAIGSSAELRKRAPRGARVVDARGLLVRPSGAGALTPGSPASLEVVEGATTDAVAGSGTVVLALVGGEIRLDRDGLAG